MNELQEAETGGESSVLSSLELQNLFRSSHLKSLKRTKRFDQKFTRARKLWQPGDIRQNPLIFLDTTYINFPS